MVKQEVHVAINESTLFGRKDYLYLDKNGERKAFTFKDPWIIIGNNGDNLCKLSKIELSIDKNKKELNFSFTQESMGWKTDGTNSPMLKILMENENHNYSTQLLQGLDIQCFDIGKPISITIPVHDEEFYLINKITISIIGGRFIKC